MDLETWYKQAMKYYSVITKTTILKKIVLIFWKLKSPKHKDMEIYFIKKKIYNQDVEEI